MAALTISAAARHCGVDRRTLQRAIRTGRLALTAEHLLTLEALAQAGYVPTALDPGASGAPRRRVAGMPQGQMPQNLPQELAQATVLLSLLERLTTTIADLYEEVRSLREDLRQLSQRTPLARRRRTRAAPQGAPQITPHVTPQGQPRLVRHAPEAPQDAPQPLPSPQVLGTYDPRAAATRIQALRGQGLSYEAIAEVLTREGISTRYGLPWQHSSVRHVLKTYGGDPARADHP